MWCWFLVGGQFLKDLWIFKVYEVFLINSVISEHVIEQKKTSCPYYIRYINLVCHALLLKIVMTKADQSKNQYLQLKWQKKYILLAEICKNMRYLERRRSM